MSPTPLAILETPDDRKPSGRTARQQCLVGADQQACPECRIEVAIPHGLEGHVVWCPECGQCLAAPPPWSPTMTDWSAARPAWPLENEKKYPGEVGITIGLLLGAVGFIDELGIYVRCGAVMLGSALFVEGLTRVLEKRRVGKGCRTAQTLPLAESAPPSLRDWSDLMAAFGTKNSWLESLAICFMGLAVASGGAWLLDFMMKGAMHPKLVLGLVLAPVGLVYFSYRSIRNVLDRKVLLIFAEGLAYKTRKNVAILPRSKIRRVACENVGDTIDEQAVQIMLTSGQPPLVFTRCHFAHLERLWERLVQEFGGRPS